MTDTGAHPVTFSPDFFAADRRKTLGGSVWLYGWLLARATPADPEMTIPTAIEGRQWGIVADGLPLPHRELATALGCSVSAIKSDLRRLVKSGYLESEPTPHGVKLRVKLPTGWVDSSPASTPRTGTDPSQIPARSDTHPTVTQGQTEIAPPASLDGDRFQIVRAHFDSIRRSLGLPVHLPPYREIESTLAWVRRHPSVSARELVTQLEAYASQTDRQKFSLSGFVTFLDRKIIQWKVEEIT